MRWDLMVWWVEVAWVMVGVVLFITLVVRLVGDKIHGARTDDPDALPRECRCVKLYSLTGKDDLIIPLPYGEGKMWAKGCECSRCAKMREITDNGYLLIPFGGWLDPRRHYLESETAFLERVPDGVLHAPDDCLWRLEDSSDNVTTRK